MSVSVKSQYSFEEHLAIIKEKTGLNPKLVIAVLGVCLSLVLIGHLEGYITSVLAIVYPAFWSMKAIESKDADDDKQWLTYWTMYSLFVLIELFFGWALHLIPFYFFIKLVFLVWLFMPNTQGAVFIYNKFLQKIFLKYEKDLDNYNEKIAGTLGTAVNKGREVIRDNQGKIIAGAISATTTVTEAINKKD